MTLDLRWIVAGTVYPSSGDGKPAFLTLSLVPRYALIVTG